MHVKTKKDVRYYPTIHHTHYLPLDTHTHTTFCLTENLPSWTQQEMEQQGGRDHLPLPSNPLKPEGMNQKGPESLLKSASQAVMSRVMYRDICAVDFSTAIYVNLPSSTQ